MAQVSPRINIDAPFEKKMFARALATCPRFKVFCALVVTVKICVLRVTTKKVVKFF